MNSKALRNIAILGIFISVFPFIVLCEGTADHAYVWWHYLAIYAVLVAFFAWGMLCAMWGTGQQHSRGFRPVALFMSRAAFVAPVIPYCVACAALELSGGMYLFIIPVQLIVFKGGYSSVGRYYHDVFGRGWFALFFVSAAVASVILWFTHDESVISCGNSQLCVSFGLLIILSAILTNQTNIDTCTHQRDAGKMALPVGLRAYNIKLCAAVSVITVGLFLLAPPLASFLVGVLKTLMGWLLSLVRGMDYDPAADDILNGSGTGAMLPYAEGNKALMDVLYFLVGTAVVILIFRYRKQIAEFFRDTFSFLFKERDSGSNIGYSDEFIEIPEVRLSLHAKRKLERQLYREYCREQDPIRKYRTGYRLMLLRLADTPFAVNASDNTDIHRYKGENGLRSEKVQSIVDTYNEVRYGGHVPTIEQLSFEESFIEDIRRKI